MSSKDKEMQSSAPYTPRTPQNCTTSANQILPSITSNIASSPLLLYWSPSLPYRSVSFLPCPRKAIMPIKRGIEPSVQPSSSIEASEEMDAALLEAYAMASREADREIFVRKFVDREEKALANQVFIEEFILSKAESIDNNAESENEELALSSSSESERLKTQPSNQAAMPRKTEWLETYSSNYAKEKLIKILDSQVLIPQQR